MFAITKTTTRPLPRIERPRHLSLLERLIRWNAAHREAQKFSTLDANARRDMGLEAETKITVAEVLARGQ